MGERVTASSDHASATVIGDDEVQEEAERANAEGERRGASMKSMYESP